jgi:DNA-directed RNA polymerase subunit RPC12/RpoP
VEENEGNQESLTPKFQDRLLVCSDCGKDFVFEAGEQYFYWRKKLDPPRRCPACRKLRKLTISEGD